LLLFYILRTAPSKNFPLNLPLEISPTKESIYSSTPLPAV
jgi:hypothetical protein